MSLRRLVVAILTVVFAAALNGVPDPDLFDGRILTTSSGSYAHGDGKDAEDADDGGNEAGNEAGSEAGDAAGNEAGSGQGSGPSRDLGKVAEVDPGEPVSVGNSKSGEIEAEASKVGSANASDQTAETAGSGQSGSEQPSSGTATSPTNPGRSFDDFEIGAIDEKNVPIEINRSKEFSEPSSTTSGENQTTHSNTRNEDGKDSPQQEQSDRSGSADYGTDVPSGL